MTREKRPVGWMIYGHPDGPGRFIPAPGRLARARDRIRPWLGSTFWTNGQACIFGAAWSAAGLIEWLTGVRGALEVTLVVVGATTVAALILRTGKRRP